MERQWHGTAARYSVRNNGVVERRVKNFLDYKSALEWLDANQDHAIQIWHDDAASLENPYFAIVETAAYKNEYRKVVD